MKTSRSGLFLIELILSIFFFIIIAAVVIQLFAKSHLISQDAVNMNHALLCTQNIAELFLGADGDFGAVEDALEPEMLTDGSTINAVLYFDSDWQRLSAQSDAAYMVIMNYTSAKENDVYAYLDIYVNQYTAISQTAIPDYDYTADCIHHQEIKKYVGGLTNG